MDVKSLDGHSRRIHHSSHKVLQFFAIISHSISHLIALGHAHYRYDLNQIEL